MAGSRKSVPARNTKVDATLQVHNHHLPGNCFIYSVKPFAFFTIILLLAACGNNGNRPHRDSLPDDLTVKEYAEDRSDIHHSCCFQSEKDFLPFFPDSSADFRPDKGARDIELKCVTDTLLVSSSTKGYLTADHQLVSVKISDYCAIGEQQLDTNYIGLLRAYRQDKTSSEFNEFEVAGIYYGFACYLPSNKLALLTIVVDKRFTVEITQHQAASSKSVMKMLEYIPVSELAQYKR